MLIQQFFHLIALAAQAYGILEVPDGQCIFFFSECVRSRGLVSVQDSTVIVPHPAGDGATGHPAIFRFRAQRDVLDFFFIDVYFHCLLRGEWF